MAVSAEPFSMRKLVHISMLGFAFLLPFLTWVQAAGAALLALLFNVHILPRLEVDLGKHTAGVAALEGPPGRAEHWTGIILYPVSVLVLILLYGRHMEIVAAVWAIMALGDASAALAGGKLGKPALPWNARKTWPGFFAFFVAATLGAYALTRWVAPAGNAYVALKISAATALVGAIVESLPIRLDDNASVPLVCGAFMYCATLVRWSAIMGNMPFVARRAALAFAVSGAFALASLLLHLVNRSGAVAGFLLGAAIYLGYGTRSFLVLLAFFAVGSAATRLGYAKKAARGIAERRHGARSWREATANTLAGAVLALLAVSTLHEAAFLVAFVAAFAEAAGDTVSSEIGQWLGEKAYLITTFERVPAGENGGITFAGTVAGVAASAAIAGLAWALGLVTPAGAALALAAGVAGNLADSVLGATIERRGLVTNGIVNFAGTSFAGGLALGLVSLAGIF